MANFHVESKRVPKIDDPLLVIGLGGTGTDALLHIMRKFKDRFILPEVNGETLDKPARTAYLAVDTDLGHLNTAGIGDLHFSMSDKLELNMPHMAELIQNPAGLMAWENAWWDTSIPPFKAGNGAGGFRQIGRLLLFRNAALIVERLRDVIKKLMEVDRHEESGNLTVVLATGIGGGTGSGIFLDMAYLIRYVIGKYKKGVDVKLMAYIIMPEVNLSHMDRPTPALTECLKKNAFAALKEMDFWMNWDQHKYVLEQTYATGISHTWETPPFNDVVLLSEGKEGGTDIKNAYSVVMDILAESLLNFFAAEQNTDTSGSFSYRSHGVNVTNESNAMNKNYPVNYAYMSVGAASSEAQQDNMVVYEAKITFDKVMELQKVPSLVGTRKADDFLEEILPQDENLYTLFDAVCPLPPYFHGEPGFDLATVINMLGDDAIHCQPYRAFVYDAEMSVRDFAKERADTIYQRFEAAVRKYANDPAYGPFAVSEMLQNPENGFATKFNKFVAWWLAQKDNAENTASAQMSHISNTLFPDMANISALAKALKMLGKADSYIQGCEQLYINKRDSLLAKYVAEELKKIKVKITDYSSVILPTFCDLVRQVSTDLNQSVDKLTHAQSVAGANMITFSGLKAYVDQQMEALSAAGSMNATTISILQKMTDASFSVSLDTGGQLEGWEDLREQFLATADAFINDMGAEINGVTMDQILNMTMPNTTMQQKIDYMTEHLMPDLSRAAQTMLKLVANDDGIVKYSYVSVPEDAPIVRAGLKEYGEANHITPKYSKINDRIYWLNTYNCLPLYRYANLSDLETAYERALANNTAMGIHLVRTQQGESSLRNDWSQLPSPIPHLLLGYKPSDRLKHADDQVSNMLEEALKTKFATLISQPTGDVLYVRIKKNTDGTIMEPEVLRERADAIVRDPKLTDLERADALEALRNDGDPVPVKYRNFADIFANVMHLGITPNDGTSAEKERASKALLAAHIAVAKYVLATQHPDLVEQMNKQLVMYSYIEQVLTPIRRRIEEQNSVLDFVKPFMHMCLFGFFSWGRTTIEFVNVHGLKVKLLGTNMLKATEMDLYGFCKELVLMQILSGDDGRVDSNDRRYLMDRVQKLMEEIEALPEEEYQAAQQQAKDFRDKYLATPDKILYDKSGVSRAVREQGAELMTAMLQEAKVFLI